MESLSRREGSRGPSPQRMVIGDHGEPLTPQNIGNDAISRVLQQISPSSFSNEIESPNLPLRFFKDILMNYDGKPNPMENVSHYNQSVTIYSKNEALMHKIFPSNLRPTTTRWLDHQEKSSIYSYNELIRAFGAKFVTCKVESQSLLNPLLLCQ